MFSLWADGMNRGRYYGRVCSLMGRKALLDSMSVGVGWVGILFYIFCHDTHLLF